MLLFSASAAHIVPGYCQNSGNVKQVKVIEGAIVDADWVGQKIVVRWLQSQGQIKYDEITIFVPENTRITKGSDTISLSDLNISDQVSVEYYDSSPGPLKAVSINVEV
jgi:hypothetical protein